MQVVPPGYWIEVQLTSYEAELRQSLRAALASESTRKAAEVHIAQSLAQRKRELEAKWPQPNITLREEFSKPMIFAGSFVGLLGIGFVLLAIMVAELTFTGKYIPAQGFILLGVFALLAVACFAGAFRLLRGRSSP